jgi:hypothetical protein
MASKLIWKNGPQHLGGSRPNTVVDVIQDELYEPKSLIGRKSKCCSWSVVPSSVDLPHFKPRPEAEFDQHYCGHMGWE